MGGDSTALELDKRAAAKTSTGTRCNYVKGPAKLAKREVEYNAGGLA